MKMQDFHKTNSYELTNHCVDTFKTHAISAMLYYTVNMFCRLEDTHISPFLVFQSGYHMNVGILDVCKNEYIPNIRDIVSDYVGILDVCKNEYIPNISGQRVIVQEQKEEQDFPIENVVTIQGLISSCRTQIMQKKCSRIGCCTKESAAALNNWLLKKTFEE
ncbi:hypothetical protein LXL04_003085 [Taraxacum kok-saghyz]